MECNTLIIISIKLKYIVNDIIDYVSITKTFNTICVIIKMTSANYVHVYTVQAVHNHNGS